MPRECTQPREQRCAIYTRKSSEEGLEQDFNSLDAQREACEAYILSQKHEGWELLPERYDDGGISGGTMERPALKRLLEQIEAGYIDVVVVYKVDRLTRSLSDFARIVDIFDDKSVSFVSVTQAFNTTTSMGRLTLNVLLSFAQFEREVTGERIRDKIAASKKKGMWMGGHVPLGYDANERTLAINEEEAGTLRTIFRLYLEKKNVRAVQHELESLRLTTKRSTTGSGKVNGGRPFSRGHIYKILSNPVYIGKIAHKGTRYPGQHPAIIDADIWDAVQTTLRSNSQGNRTRANAKDPSLLAGLLFDEQGNRFTATHAVKSGKRYRYYVCQDREDRSLRIPAFEIEATVTRALSEFLLDMSRLTGKLMLEGYPPECLKTIFARARLTASEIQTGTTAKKRTLFLDLSERITIAPSTMQIALKRTALGAQLLGATNRPDTKEAGDGGGDLKIDCPVRFTRRGVEMGLVLNGTGNSAPDAALIKAVARGHVWFEELVTGHYTSVRELCRSEKVDESTVAKLLRLAFLSPTIVKQILEGNQPPETTRDKLIAWGSWPMRWEEQDEKFGNGAATELDNNSNAHA
jgi:site-specific DNA recombinase